MKKKILKLILVMTTIISTCTLLGVVSNAATYYYKYPSNGTYYIQSACGYNKVLDVYNASNADGANITIYDKHGGNNQKFKIEKTGNYYTMTAVHSGKRVDVYGCSATSGTNVNQWSANNSYAQLWKFIDAGNGYYYIRSALGTVLDLYDGYTSNGTNVTTYSWNFGDNQKWKLVPANDDVSTNGKLSFSNGSYVKIGNTTNYVGNTFYTWNSNGTSSSTGSNYNYYSYVKVNGSMKNTGSTQCLAYARYIQELLYGANDWKNASKFKKDYYGSSHTANEMKVLITNAGGGAHIRVGNDRHSYIVLKTDSNGFYYTDANGSGDRKINVSYLTWQGLVNRYGRIYMVSKYKG